MWGLRAAVAAASLVQIAIGLVRALRCLCSGLANLVGLIHGVTGVLIGRKRMLVRSRRLLGSSVDPALRPFIDLLDLVVGVFNSLAVTAGLFAYLI